MQRLLPVFSLALLSVLPAFGWWETGHEVVARIAVSQLTPAAQTRVARILGVPDTEKDVANALATASIWADQTKGETKTGEWHYIDLTLDDHKDDWPKRCPDDNCLPARITYFETLLKEHPTEANPRWTDLESLRFLVHFVGDSVQPLHTITDADAGGNCEKVDPPFEKAKNVHALWDGGLVGAMHESDAVLAQNLEARIKTMSPRERRRLAKGTVMDWVWESHQLARKDIYRDLHIPDVGDAMPKGCPNAPAGIRDFTVKPNRAYVGSMEPVVRLQLIKGGLRLARVLNETL